MKTELLQYIENEIKEHTASLSEMEEFKVKYQLSGPLNDKENEIHTKRELLKKIKVWINAYDRGSTLRTL